MRCGRGCNVRGQLYQLELTDTFAPYLHQHVAPGVLRDTVANGKVTSVSVMLPLMAPVLASSFRVTMPGGRPAWPAINACVVRVRVPAR